MKRSFILILLFLVMLFGCNKKTVFKPNIQQVINSIEVYSEYNPLDFIRDVSSTKYNIEVIDNQIDVMKTGNYNVTYRVSDSESNSVEYTYLISVVDKTQPIITVLSDITTVVHNELDITQFIQVRDNYDTNLIDKMEIIGHYDITHVGDYQVHLQVIDSSNNKTTKTVTIYVLEDELNSDDNSLVGMYKVNYSDEDEVNPYLILYNDDTYSLLINYCVGLRTFTGNYTVDGNQLILVSDTFTFDDDDPSSNTLTLTINNDGSLTYTNSFVACSPLKDDIFYKR